MSEPPSTEEWTRILNGEIPGLRMFQRILRKIPSEPRCKLCFAPFGKPGNLVIRAFGGKPSPLNRRLCTWCMKSAHKHPGGAEVEISALFADVRGSTGLAERLPPGEFGKLLTRFWGTAARVVDRWDGIVDKFVGDEAVALFIPGFAGPDHAARAVKSALAMRERLRDVNDRHLHQPLRMRLAINSGRALVGDIGAPRRREFTVLGDVVNTASRLQTFVCEPDQILMSEATYQLAGRPVSARSRGTVQVKGRSKVITVYEI